MNYIKELQKLYVELNTNPDKGLGTEQVKEARKKYGENRFKEKKHISFTKRFVNQLKDFMIIILIIASILSFFLASKGDGSYIEGSLILAIVLINALLGAIQENSAEKALNSLKKMNTHYSKVIRNGELVELKSDELVPGDIIVLESGDYIPADARLIESSTLKVEESSLTGESLAVDKNENAKVDKNCPIGDRVNMVYSGCIVTNGRAKAVVTEIGMDTEMGKIAAFLNNEKTKNTPLQEKLAKLGKTITIGAIGACLILFIIGILQGESAFEMFIAAVALAVAAIPESLTGVVTISLSFGVTKMVKKHAIIRRLPAVETLGCASVICSDKTGTLTQNKMTVTRIWSEQDEILKAEKRISDEGYNVLKFAALCSNAKIEMNGLEENEFGDATEVAIVRAFKDYGCAKTNLNNNYNRIHEIPFDSGRKLMTTVNEIKDNNAQAKGKYCVIVKGAFDVLLPKCIHGEFEKTKKANSDFAKSALRVISVAYKFYDELPDVLNEETLENDLTLLGIIGIIDPPRDEVKESIIKARNAGIKTIMITGDHIITATAIAKELSILESDSEAITGKALNEMTDEELQRNINNYSVYARVSPEDKIRIVKAWQSNGDVVVMTGDGVNDSPALKAADIGCAMGITGTDVAKEASDMILTDDNFSTIIDAVEEGRSIYDNIRKTVEFFLSCNIAEVIIVFMSFLLGWGSPILAIQLLLINVVADALPAFGLSKEKTDDNIMSRKPVDRNNNILADGLGVKILLQAIMFAIVTLFAFYLGTFTKLSETIAPSKEVGITMCFLVMAFSSIIHVFNCRSSQSIFKIKLKSNKDILKGAAASIIIILLICFVPVLSEIFGVEVLGFLQWILVIILSVLPLIIVEIVKFFVNRIK
ncbi:calcium-translocating P-type ATPase, PMCA-type [Clostridium botulinum]|uniref:calcium-translocating P-type ATPase, PMCA-type n=1 Tax=unclassified Clostridium TaxID=2614128 RepID=UPI000505CD94|nr:MULTISPECIES: calcium-translocating P-type ATPase, PMCA-type [unclassified Clostridium]KFX54589.1 metal ABC transporter ATPase [Clostridium botulinum]MBY6778413.1 calcium-translocating P-type ATPase, PMCA-type [Clostridium botulinum]MBY6850600.1 calcium-translocating P-type ATPase, PMCA-type [Clostridium botulinum]MBY7006943.1 calcium-translocating P-type ATPase, PMCA-type [Clostridium botulinum]NFH72141.1 calcium-translocating P-type ATPase, PMCA-type [Clostridium botulinum]